MTTGGPHYFDPLRVLSPLLLVVVREARLALRADVQQLGRQALGALQSPSIRTYSVANVGGGAQRRGLQGRSRGGWQLGP